MCQQPFESVNYRGTEELNEKLVNSAFIKINLSIQSLICSDKAKKK